MPRFDAETARRRLWSNLGCKRRPISRVSLTKYYFLKQIRSNSKKVGINDLETEMVVLYPSIYKAALAFDKNPGVIGKYNGKVWRNRYAIKVLTENF